MSYALMGYDYRYHQLHNYNGVRKYYFAFEEAVEWELKKAGLMWVMEGKHREPFVPVAALERMKNEEDPLPTDYEVIELYQQWQAEYTAECTKALSLYTSHLGLIPISRLDDILSDNDISDREKLQKCRVEMRTAYGATSMHVVLEILDDMNQLPNVVDGSTAMLVISSLCLLNKILKKMGQSLTDAQLKRKLFDKLSGDIMIYIDKNEDMTYASACDEINRVIYLRNRSITCVNSFQECSGSDCVESVGLMGAARHAPLAFEFPGALGAPLRGSVSPSTDIGMRRSVLTETNTHALRPALPRCRNCSELHALRECPATHCYKCRRWWPSKRDPTFHNFYECPAITRDRQMQRLETLPALRSKRGHWDEGTETRARNREKKSRASL